MQQRVKNIKGADYSVGLVQTSNYLWTKQICSPHLVRKKLTNWYLPCKTLCAIVSQLIHYSNIIKNIIRKYFKNEDSQFWLYYPYIALFWSIFVLELAKMFGKVQWQNMYKSWDALPCHMEFLEKFQIMRNGNSPKALVVNAQLKLQLKKDTKLSYLVVTRVKIKAND